MKTGLVAKQRLHGLKHILRRGEVPELLPDRRREHRAVELPVQQFQTLPEALGLLDLVQRRGELALLPERRRVGPARRRLELLPALGHGGFER